MAELKKLLLITPILILLCLTSCKDDDSSNGEFSLSTNCPFVENDGNDGLIDENESEILANCSANKLTVKEEIEANLIGSWILIGHGEGWDTSNSEPCSSLYFTADSLTLDFEDSHTDIISISSWSLDVLETQNGDFFRLNAPNIEERADAVNLQGFCEEFIFVAYGPDSNSYIYQKVD